MKTKLVFFLALCALLLVPTMVSAQAANGDVGHQLTPGRLWASLDALAGLINVILAGRALARSRTRVGNNGKNGAIAAVVVGLLVIAYAVVHLNKFTGDFGTGAGRAGAIVAIVLGLTSTVLAGITLTRSRRSQP